MSGLQHLGQRRSVTATGMDEQPAALTRPAEDVCILHGVPRRRSLLYERRGALNARRRRRIKAGRGGGVKVLPCEPLYVSPAPPPPNEEDSVIKVAIQNLIANRCLSPPPPPPPPPPSTTSLLLHHLSPPSSSSSERPGAQLPSMHCSWPPLYITRDAHCSLDILPRMHCFPPVCVPPVLQLSVGI